MTSFLFDFYNKHVKKVHSKYNLRSGINSLICLFFTLVYRREICYNY